MTGLANPPRRRSGFRLGRGRADLARVTPANGGGDSQGYRIEETSWGFRVRGREVEGALTRAGQAASLAVGLAVVVASLSLLGPILADPDEATWPLRLGLAVLVGGGGLLMLWFATRGTLVTTEVDGARGEVRAVVPNLLGPATLLATHGLDAVAGVRVARTFGGRGMAVLWLDCAGGESMAVATGTEADLAPLRRRLQRDLMPGAQALARPDERADELDHGTPLREAC